MTASEEEKPSQDLLIGDLEQSSPFTLLQPRPLVLFLNACHSESVLDRAMDAAVQPGSTIVYIAAETLLEVTAGVAFQALFYDLLLQGETVGAAFATAQIHVANNRVVGDLSVNSKEIPPSAKFRLQADIGCDRIAGCRSAGCATDAARAPHPSDFRTLCRATPGNGGKH